MKNLTEIVADAFGESSHLIRFHQITRALSLHGACSGNEQTPQLCVLQAAKLCLLLFHSLRTASPRLY